MANITIQVEEPPEVTYVNTEDGPMVEWHFRLSEGTLDMLMSPAVATAALVAGSVERTRQEEINEPTR